MNATYEKDITENLGDNRNLILLGVRADADINHLNDLVANQKSCDMYLTGKEIKDLAEYAGFTIEEKSIEADVLDQEFSVDECPKAGVQNDDGSIDYYSYVVTCDGCDGNECTPLGNPINKQK